MTETLSSYEDILDFTSTFFVLTMKKAPAYYDRQFHVTILKNMMCKALNVKCIKVTEMDIELPEPIITHEEPSRTIYIISLPLVGLYLTKLIKAELETIEIIEKFDFTEILNRAQLENAKKSKEDEQRRFLDMTTCTYQPFVYDDDAEERLTPSQEIAYELLLRCTCLVRHWRQHIISKTTKSLNCDSFESPELAARSKKTKKIY